MNKKVALAFSGGADSTFAAIALKEKGYDVVAFNFPIGKHLSENVEQTAKKLNINLHVIDIGNVFEQVIKEDFYKSYLSGLTPNPCVRCNRYIKFGLFYTIIKNKFNIEKIATGHYAKIYQDEKGRFFIQKAKDRIKDQSYFLWGIPKNILPNIIFPLGNYSKSEVKEILRDKGLNEIANKEESFDICFTNNDSYKKYIEKYDNNQNLKSGFFVDSNGNILGEYQGIFKYTIGQRKGLNLAFGKRMYVRNIDFEQNKIELGEKPCTKSVIAGNLNLFINNDEFSNDYIYTAKIRYKSKEERAKLEIVNMDNKKKIKLEFLKEVEASASGQSLVIYKDDIIIAGGIIENIVLY